METDEALAWVPKVKESQNLGEEGKQCLKNQKECETVPDAQRIHVLNKTGLG